MNILKSLPGRMLLGLTFALVPTGIAAAEPWISTRYAQNCAGCHAPGRKNLVPIDRRCTLACQGCHISPSGGGLRSYYGKWNEDRWLRSFRADALANAKFPAPTKAQRYGSKGAPEKDAKGKSAGKDKENDKKRPSSDADRLKMPPDGFRHVELNGYPANEALYDRRDRLEFMVVDREEFEYQVPVGDPYREMRRNKIDAGADIRWQIRKSAIETVQDDESTETESWVSFPMAIDMGASFRPFYRHLRFVLETRAVTSPANPNESENIYQNIGRRSLYAMVDDLPYNLYVMGGFYRPLFGYYTPDHTFLPQRMQGWALQGNPATYNLQYEAYSFGGSPNVPYANVHIISKQLGPVEDTRVKGVAANIGGRFVTLGASINYSYWLSRVKSEVAGKEEESKTEMHSLFGSAMVGRFVLTLDLASFAKDDPASDFRRGGVYSFDGFFKLWRETYLNGQFAYANTHESLMPGSGTQMRFGTRMFLNSGVELMLHYEIDKQTLALKDQPEQETNRSGIVGQLHLFM